MTQFKHPIPKDPTNKVQFAMDDSEFVELGPRVLGRGEVFEVKSAKRAAEIVRHPKFAYAPADAPVGPQKAGTDAGNARGPFEPLSMQIRESSRGRSDLTIEAQRRLMELEEAARSSELISADADASEEIKAGAVKQLEQIVAEWQTLIRTKEGTE